jgi:BolA family transcriptional regulator, general stress-responsive regulator
MTTLQLIEQIISQKLEAEFVKVEDQSDRHKNHAGRKHAPIDSGHYDLLVISKRFENLTAIECHRLIYTSLEEQMQSRIHALSIRAYSPQQWQQLGESNAKKTD